MKEILDKESKKALVAYRIQRAYETLRAVSYTHLFCPLLRCFQYPFTDTGRCAGIPSGNRSGIWRNYS